MLRAAVILGLCLVLAGPAAAQTAEKGRLTVIKPSAKALDLRGAVKPAGVVGAPGAPRLDNVLAAPAADLSPELPPPAPLQSTAPEGLRGPDTAQCRQSCSRSYYFCLGGDVTVDCGAAWSQCRSDCNGYNPIQGLGSRAAR